LIHSRRAISNHRAPTPFSHGFAAKSVDEVGGAVQGLGSSSTPNLPAVDLAKSAVGRVGTRSNADFIRTRSWSRGHRASRPTSPKHPADATSTSTSTPTSSGSRCFVDHARRFHRPRVISRSASCASSPPLPREPRMLRGFDDPEPGADLTLNGRAVARRTRTSRGSARPPPPMPCGARRCRW
jgi:hypothetical protein